MEIKFMKAWGIAVSIAALTSGDVSALALNKRVPRSGEGVMLNETPLEKFTGFYRFPNQVAYIQFAVEKGQLIARQVWDGRTYPLIRNSDTRFQSEEEEYAVVFDLSEVAATATILNRVVLSKVDFDPTQKQKLTIAKAGPWLGKYRMAKDHTMIAEVKYKEGKLALHQDWDDKEIVFESLTSSEFINESLAFPVKFRRSDDGRITMICFTEDTWEKIN